MAHPAATHLTVSQLLAEGSDFARDAWRECCLPMLLVTASHALMFINQHVAAAEWHPGALGWIAPLMMVFYVPLYGGLYRIALGGKPAASIGPGGLQWSAVEWRLIAVGLVVVFMIGLAMTPFSAVTGIAAMIFRNGVFSAGPFGQWARWTPFAIVVWGVFFWVFAPRIARLMLAWPFSVARQKTEPFAGFSLSKGSGWPIALALVACFVPLVLGWLAYYAIGLVEADAISGVYWPLPEAAGVGILLGALKAGVVAPMIVGVLSGAYWLLEGDQLAAEGGVPAKHHHTGLLGLAEAAIAAAAALAAKEAADLGAATKAAEGEAREQAPSSQDQYEEPSAASDDGIEPLSPWPHSVLPPWPVHEIKDVAAPETPAAAPAEPTEAVDSLASEAEPAHPSDGVTESG